ncbi:MAG: pyridoxal-dependent decarboxylase, exosortase A system-associated [Acidobacteriota bacterium]
MNREDSLWAFDRATCELLASRHGTPVFAYSAEVAAMSYGSLRAALPERVRLAYAVKANPLGDLLRLLADAGASFDVASGGELGRVMACGVESDHIFFTGPGKRDSEIRRAVDLGVRLQAEGFEDLARAEAAAQQLGLEEVAVNLRVQPLGVEESGHEKGAILGGSGPTVFGVDEEDLPELLERARGLERVRIRGLHGFAASNERDADRLLENHRCLLRIGRRLTVDYGLRLEHIDLGGGLGVPYAAGEEPLDLARLGQGLETLLEQAEWFKGELILEPGRYLSAACGVYLTRVVRTKTSRGERFAILDGGIHHLLRPLLTGEPFPVRGPARESEESESAGEPTTLAGPLCTALDRFGSHELPALRPGDLVTLGMVGAYGATEAMVRFLDHPPAEELWVEGDPW